MKYGVRISAKCSKCGSPVPVVGSEVWPCCNHANAYVNVRPIADQPSADSVSLSNVERALAKTQTNLDSQDATETKAAAPGEEPPPSRVSP